jgi:outer membrane protein assembly factor BamB
VKTAGGTPIDGATISPGFDVEGTVTDASGYYELKVPPGWSGTVTVSKADWGIAPPSRTYSSVAADQTNQDYTAFQPKISGYVRDSGGTGIVGVAVSADNGGGSDTTDATGYYQVTVPYGWSGTVTPVKEGWHIDPPNWTYTNVVADQSNQNYSAFQPKISGYVRDPAGAAAQGVAISADNGGGSDTTDALGYYEITVPYNWSGTVTPQKLGWQFVPSGHSYSNVTTNQEGQDFSGAYVGFTVRKDGSGDYTSIQAAIDAVPIGHTITVAQDVYYENIDFKGKNLTLTSTEPNDPNVVANTIIDGQNSGSVVTFSGSETEDCILTGFTITDGNVGYRAYGGGILGNTSTATIISCVVSGNAAEWGAGIAKCAGEIIDCRISNNFARTSGAGLCQCSGTIRDCNITQNTAGAWGGGLINCGTIVNCVFSENSAGIGGALYGGSTIINCLISSNTAGLGAGLARCNGTVEDCEIVDNNSNAFFECDGTVTNCLISRNSAGNGGGFRDCSITINNCTISENYARSRGGGLFNCNGLVTDSLVSQNTAAIGGGVYGGRATIINCVISNNSAEDGGGLLSYNGNISDSTISDNSASDDGGGFRQCDGTIFNCTISGNSAGYRGGALDWCDGTISHCMITDNTAYRAVGIAWCDGVVKNCVVMNNTATSYGGGIFSSMATIQNCTVVGNSASSCAGLDNCDGPIRNCIVWGNTGTQVCGSSVPSYSCIQGWTSGGTGNFSADPLFLPDGYHIWGGSSCIDAGDPNYVPEPNETDIDGRERVVGRIDAGADEVYSPNAPLLHLPQNIAIENYGLPDLSWMASTDCGWLALDPLTGVSSFLVGSTTTVSADITGMTEGIYTCTVTISDTDSNNSPQTVDVNLQVIGPILSVSPNDFNFAATHENRTPAAQTLSISNDGGGTLNWQIDVPNDCNWLSASPAAGAATTEVDEVTLSVDATGLSYGVHSVNLMVTAPNSANSVQVVAVNLQLDGPVISVSPYDFDFAAATNDPHPPDQTLSISNWLSADPMTGDCTSEVDQVALGIDASALRGGSYNCELTVRDSNAENNPQMVSVSLQVDGPLISTSVGLIKFRQYLNAPPPEEQTFDIINTGVDALHWQIHAPNDCNWLNVSPATGTSDDVSTVTLSIDANGLSRGTHSCNLSISDGKAENSPQTVQVILWVIATEGILYVPSDLTTIQEAIDAAVGGDKVLVEPGTYTGVGNRNIDFLGKAITVQSLDPTDACTVAATIIDCEGAGRGFYFHRYEQQNSILDGLTIMNGYADEGGGVFCAEADPTIRNCVITGNAAVYGAGICCDEGARPAVTNCTISYNSAMGAGGGLAACYGPVNSCLISDNSASIGGGAWACRELNNCIISGNYAGDCGGGVEGCKKLNSCLVVGNSAWQSGGGMYFCQDWPQIRNCTVAWNRVDSGFGGGISFACSYTNGTVSNSIIWGNTDSDSNVASAQIYYDYVPQVTFSCIQDNDANDASVPFGGADSNNIDDYPQFRRDASDGGDGWGDDPCTPAVDEGANDDLGDLHLVSGSPCIDAGDPLSWIRPEDVDLDSEPRVMGGRIDIGADEFPYPRIVVTKPQGGEVWVGESSHHITWLSEVYQGPVDILFSSNGGTDWDTVETAAENIGSYLWHLLAADSNQCVIAVIPSVPDPNVSTTESGLFVIRPDTPGPPVASKWKTLGGDYDRKGLSQSYGPELGCVKWEFEVDGAISASVTVGPNDTVYVPCEDGNLYKLDSNGVVLWSHEMNSPLISSPSIGPDGTAYIAAKNGRLCAVDVNGNLRWTHSIGGMVYSSPAVSADGNTILVGSEDGTLCALGWDGSELWSFETDGFGETEGAIFASPAIGPNGTVYVAGLYDPNLYALGPNNGSVKWVCNFEYLIDPYHPWEGTESGWPFASPVVAPDGTIYQALAYDPNLYAIEPNGGTIIWSAELVPHCDFIDDYLATHQDYPPIELIEQECQDWFGIPPIYWFRHMDSSCWSEPALGPDGTIYVSYEDPFLRAVEPNGAIKWVTRLGVMGGFTLTVGSDGLIYAASDDGYLCVVDANGNELSRFATDKWLGFPVVLADNILMVGDSMDNSMLISYTNNKLWALGGQDCQGQPLDLHRPEDLDMSGPIDFVDFAWLAANWLACADQYDYPYGGGWVTLCYDPLDEMYLTGDVDRNLYVDWADVAALADWWLSED